MGLTSDPNDPRLTHGADETPVGQAPMYLILPETERRKKFIRPLRFAYRHVCGSVTTMAPALAETYARDPSFYGATYCCSCRKHRPVGEFRWTEDDTIVGS